MRRDAVAGVEADEEYLRDKEAVEREMALLTAHNDNRFAQPEGRRDRMGTSRPAIHGGGADRVLACPAGPGGAIPGVEGWEWIHTPGHTPGNVAYVRARDRVVLSGDAILTLEVYAWADLLQQRHGFPGPPWYTTWDRPAAIASISEIADLEPYVLASGHGPPLAGPGTAAAVHAFAERTMRSPRRIGPNRGNEDPAAGYRAVEAPSVPRSATDPR